MEEYLLLNSKYPLEKENYANIKFNSPICTKTTPKFHNTLKKNNNLTENKKKPLVETTNYLEYFPQTKKKQKIGKHLKSKSNNFQNDPDEDLGFIKNKVEIINNSNFKKYEFPQKLSEKIPTKSSKLTTETNVTDRSNNRLNLQTIESILLEKSLKSSHKILNTKDNIDRSININYGKNFQLKTEQSDKSLIRDKEIINNLNMLCIIQKNLNQIAQRKKDYLSNLLMKKSLSSDSNPELQKLEEEDSMNFSQPPIDEFKEIETSEPENLKIIRSHSFSTTEPAFLKKVGKNFPPKTRKLTTIDFDDFEEENSQITKKNSESNDDTDTTAEIVRLLSVKDNQKPRQDIISKSHAGPFKKEKEIEEPSKLKFLREFVINYPLSKKMEFNKYS